MTTLLLAYWCPIPVIFFCNCMPCFGFHLEGNSQLAPCALDAISWLILHIMKTRSTRFVTKYDKNSIIGWAKVHSKTGCSLNDWKSSKTLRRLKWNSRCTLISGLGELFSKCPGQRGPKADCFLLKRRTLFINAWVFYVKSRFTIFLVFL